MNTRSGIPKTAIPFLITFSMLPAMRSQEVDFQTRWKAQIDKRISNRVVLITSIDQIFKENSLRYDRSMLTFSGRFGLMRGLNLSTGVRWMIVQDSENEIAFRGRIHTNLTYEFNVSRFYIELRTRLLYGFDGEVFNTPFSHNKLVNSDRFEIGYDFLNSMITPFAGTEPFIHINRDPWGQPYKFRIYGGLSFELNDLQLVKVTYLNDNEFNFEDPLDINMLWITYEVRF